MQRAKVSSDNLRINHKPELVYLGRTSLLQHQVVVCLDRHHRLHSCQTRHSLTLSHKHRIAVFSIKILYKQLLVGVGDSSIKVLRILLREEVCSIKIQDYLKSTLVWVVRVDCLVVRALQVDCSANRLKLVVASSAISLRSKLLPRLPQVVVVFSIRVSVSSQLQAVFLVPNHHSSNSNQEVCFQANSQRGCSIKIHRNSHFQAVVCSAINQQEDYSHRHHHSSSQVVCLIVSSQVQVVAHFLVTIRHLVFSVRVTLSKLLLSNNSNSRTVLLPRPLTRCTAQKTPLASLTLSCRRIIHSITVKRRSNSSPKS